MARFGRERDSGDSRGRRDSRGRSGSKGDSNRGSSGRDYADRRGKGNFRDRGSSRRDSGDRDSRRELTMHKTVCDECGQKCEVPFKPTEGKPIYCSDCFKKKGNGNSNKDFTKEFEEINNKLDKIMSALKIDNSE